MKKLLLAALVMFTLQAAFAQTTVTCGSKTYSIPGELVATLKNGTMVLRTYAAIKNDSVMFSETIHMDGKLSFYKTYRMAIKTIDAVASTIEAKATGYKDTPNAFMVTFNKPMFGGTIGSIFTEMDGCSYASSTPRATKQGFAMAYFDTEAKAKEFQQKVFAKGAELLKP